MALTPIAVPSTAVEPVGELAGFLEAIERGDATDIGRALLAVGAFVDAIAEARSGALEARIAELEG